MKKRFFVLTWLLFLTWSLSANVLLTEEFDYTAGTAVGETVNWTTTGTLTTGEGRVTDATTLEYSNSGGEYILSGGRSLKHNYTEGADYISYRSFSKVESGAVYLTYMYKPDGKQSQSNGELLGLTTGTSPSARPWGGKIDDTTKGDPFRIGITHRIGTGSAIVWGSGEYSINNVLLLVLKYDLTNHSTSLFVNPTLGTIEEPVADITDNNEAEQTARTKIDAIMFRNQGKSKSNYYIGGIRVSTTWAEAVEAKGVLPTDVTLARVITNFNDGTWGTIVDKDGEKPASGSYGSSSRNGLELNAAYMMNGSITCTETSESFTNRIILDKSSENGMVTLPAISNASQIVVYAGSGGDNKALTLQKYNYLTKQWVDVETYKCLVKSTCYRFVTLLNSNEVTKLRLVNADSSGKQIYKIQTYPMPPVVARERIAFDFSADEWNGLGNESTTANINDVDFTQCSRQIGTYYLLTGEKLTGRITLAAKSGVNCGIIELPAVASAARVDIYASAGSDNKDMKLQQYNYGIMEWEDVETLHFAVEKIYYRFSVTLNSTTATRLRIINADGSGKYIVRVVTFLTAPTDLAVPVVSEAENVAAHSFAAKWAPVENASGYRVVVFKEDGSRKTTKEIESGDIIQYNISGLDHATNYTFKVAARGDGETIIDSDLSEAVAFTTAPEINDIYTRVVTNGNYGTICLPKASDDLSSAGADFFEVAGKVMEGNALKSIVLDEVTALEVGVPYVFLATADALNIPLTGDAVAEPNNDNSNGLTGAFTLTKVGSSNYHFILSNNKLYCSKNQTYYVGENRAYFNIENMTVFNGSSPAPGRRRVEMNVQEEQTATGMEDVVIQEGNGKVIIDGHLIIIHQGIRYDITGQRID